MKNLKSEHFLTIGDASQFPGLFQGSFLKGKREPRIAFVGRSNVGKSSLLNSLLEARLAQTSKQPGKTRAIHCYYWGKAQKILVDLPGYGYARASQEERNRWETFIRTYFEEETRLERVLLLLDARHGPTKVDQEAIRFLSLNDIPVTFIFTKTDTLKTQAERAARKKETVQAIQSLGYDKSSIFWVSSEKETGLKELVQFLAAKVLDEEDSDIVE